MGRLKLNLDILIHTEVVTLSDDFRNAFNKSLKLMLNHSQISTSTHQAQYLYDNIYLQKAHHEPLSEIFVWLFRAY